MFESVPTKVIAPTGVAAARAIVAAKNRTDAAAAEIRSHAHTVRIADVVIEPLQLRVQGRQGKEQSLSNQERFAAHVDLTPQSGKVVWMRRVAIILCAALVLGLPTISSAQYNDNDQQNPKEYHDEDSQPLAIVSYLFYPIGYAFEWLVARPLHYVATESPAAPVFKDVDGNDTAPPPPAPIIPDNTLNSAAAESNTPQDWSPTRAPSTTSNAVPAWGVAKSAPAAQSSSAPPSGSQPVLH